MTKDERVQEIARLQNFQTGLQKQIGHYSELIEKLLAENCMIDAKYTAGSIVIVHDYGRTSDGSPLRVALKIVDMKSDVSKVDGDYLSEIIYRCCKPHEEADKLATGQSCFIRESLIEEVIAVPVTEVYLQRCVECDNYLRLQARILDLEHPKAVEHLHTPPLMHV